MVTETRNSYVPAASRMKALLCQFWLMITMCPLLQDLRLCPAYVKEQRYLILAPMSCPSPAIVVVKFSGPVQAWPLSLAALVLDLFG